MIREALAGMSVQEVFNLGVMAGTVMCAIGCVIGIIVGSWMSNA